MKSIILTLHLALCLKSILAQTNYFNNIYVDSQGDGMRFTNIEVDSANSYFELFGVSGESGYHRLIRRRIDFEGNFIDDAELNFGDTSLYPGIAESFLRNQNGYIATYACFFGGIMAKYNESFETDFSYIKWNTNTSAFYYMRSIQLIDGNTLALGNSITVNSLGTDSVSQLILTKFSPSGGTIWDKNVSAIKPFFILQSAFELTNQDIIVSGSQAFDFDAIVMRLDSEGNLLWQKTFQSAPEEEYDDLWCPSVLVNDSILVLSYGYGYDDEYPPQPWVESSVRKLHLVKLNVNTQEIIWEQEYPQIYGGRHYMNDIISSNDDGFVICGNLGHLMYWPLFGPTVPGFDFSYLAKTNSEGELQWQRRYTYSSDSTTFYGDQNFLFDVELAPDGGYVACGYLDDFGISPRSNAWVIKVDEFGCLEPGCQNVDVNEIRLDMDDALSIYPNPVTTNCTVELNISTNRITHSNEETSLILIDPTGKQLQRILVPPFINDYKLQIDLSNYSGGVYQMHWINKKALLDSFQFVKQY